MKLDSYDIKLAINVSHPSWVCGLKLKFPSSTIEDYRVTPFVGVWIETFNTAISNEANRVTPFVGVWIETHH